MLLILPVIYFVLFAIFGIVCVEMGHLRLGDLGIVFLSLFSSSFRKYQTFPLFSYFGISQLHIIARSSQYNRCRRMLSSRCAKCFQCHITHLPLYQMACQTSRTGFNTMGPLPSLTGMSMCLSNTSEACNKWPRYISRCLQMNFDVNEVFVFNLKFWRCYFLWRSQLWIYVLCVILLDRSRLPSAKILHN